MRVNHTLYQSSHNEDNENHDEENKTKFYW